MPLKIVVRPDTGALTITGTVKLPDGTGHRVRTRASSDDRRLAEEEAAAIEATILRNAWHGERRGVRSFAEAVESYLRAQARAKGDRRRLGRIMLALGDVPLSAVDQAAVYRVQAKTLAVDASPATVRRGVITPIRAVLNHAHELGWCDAPRFKVPRQPQGRTRYLLPAEAERLIEAAAPHVRPLIEFLLCTGARMSEALELEWRDVDIFGRRVTFWKTKGGNRRVAALQLRAIHALGKSGTNDGRVFRTGRGLAYSDRNRIGGGQIKTGWRGALRRAVLGPEITPHDLRHTWASWHYAVQRDLLLLKQEGGWASVSMVERYAHLLPAGHEAEIRAFWHEADTSSGAQDVSA